MESIILYLLVGSSIIAVTYAMRRHGGFTKSLKSINAGRDELENLLVDFVSGVVPWFSSVIPAYFSYVHVNNILEVPKVFALILAIVVEAVGFANISTAITFSEYNKEKQFNKNFEKQKAPTSKIVANLGLYLTVIILVNGLLGFFGEVPVDVFLEGTWEEIVLTTSLPFIKQLAIMLLSLMTIPGAITIAARNEHRRKIAPKPKAQKEKKAAPIKSERQPPKQDPSFTDRQTEFLDFLRENTGALKNKSETSRIFGASRPTIDKWIQDFVDRGIIKVLPSKSVIIRDGNG